VVWVWSATTCKGPGAAESAGGDALQFWGEEAIKITLPYGQRSVQALAFSEEGQNLSEDGEEVDDEDEDEAMEGETTFRYSGDLLVTVSTDNEHTVNVWKWREKGADGNAKLLAYAPNTQVGRQQSDCSSVLRCLHPRAAPPRTGGPHPAPLCMAMLLSTVCPPPPHPRCAGCTSAGVLRRVPATLQVLHGGGPCAAPGGA
jgi:hypothetical protein